MAENRSELTAQQLQDELDHVERAIARSTTFVRRVDSSGHTQLRVSPDLLALAEQEQSILDELRDRRPSPLVA